MHLREDARCHRKKKNIKRWRSACRKHKNKHARSPTIATTTTTATRERKENKEEICKCKMLFSRRCNDRSIQLCLGACIPTYIYFNFYFNFIKVLKIKYTTILYGSVRPSGLNCSAVIQQEVRKISFVCDKIHKIQLNLIEQTGSSHKQ